MIGYTLLLLFSSLILTDSVVRIPLFKDIHKSKDAQRRYNRIFVPKHDNRQIVPIKNHELSEPKHGNEQAAPIKNKVSADDQTNPLNTALNKLNSHYYANIAIGFPKQTLKVLLDTTSGSLWVTCAGCSPNNEACVRHNQFNCQTSLSCVDTKKDVTVTKNYIPSFGKIVTDSVCIGNGNHSDCTSDQQTLACITHPEYTQAVTTYDGILGLSWANISEGLTHPLDQIFNSGECDQHVIALWFSRGDNAGGEISLCGTNSSLYTGEITWVNVKYEDTWTFVIDQILINNTVLASNTVGIIDTSGISITGPSNLVFNIHSILAGKEIVSGVEIIDCASTDLLPNITFVIQGHPFTLTPHDYLLEVSLMDNDLCASGFIPSAKYRPDGPQWEFGENFLQNYYTVLDRTNKRIGLATAK